jgi:hypothetical protein
MYGWATFKKMGASRTIARAYKCALALSICIQLEIFFYIASVGSYIDEISKSILGANPHFRTMYLIGYTVTTICVIPWLSLVSDPVSSTLTVSSAHAGLVRHPPGEQEDDVRFLLPGRLVFGY